MLVDGAQLAIDDQPLVDGAAVFTATLSPSDDPFEAEVVATATVHHPALAALDGTISDTYTADALPPAIALTQPAGDLLALGTHDEDPAPGLQVTLSGTAAGFGGSHPIDPATHCQPSTGE